MPLLLRRVAAPHSQCGVDEDEEAMNLEKHIQSGGGFAATPVLSIFPLLFLVLYSYLVSLFSAALFSAFNASCS